MTRVLKRGVDDAVACGGGRSLFVSDAANEVLLKPMNVPLHFQMAGP